MVEKPADVGSAVVEGDVVDGARAEGDAPSYDALFDGGCHYCAG